MFGVSVLIFLVLRFTPGDPAERILSQEGEYQADREAIARLRAEWGLDLALPVQYGRWIANVAVGDFGRSFATGRPVVETLAERLPATLQLAALALAVAVALALPLGVLAAANAGGPVDALCRALSLVGASVPSFWLGLLLVWVFAVRLGWLPAIGRGGPQHLVLPAAALGVGVCATQARLLRASLLETLAEQYVLVARAKGVSARRVLWRHALRNALIPSTAALGVSLGSLLGGAAVVETVFAYPGMGKLAVDAISIRDYPVVQAFVILMTLAFALAGLVVDLVSALIDPRIRVGAAD
jgi:peptide/nickel transport system permease protein